MYRIFCESYENYIRGSRHGDERLRIAELFGLIVDAEKYHAEREKNTVGYKNLCDMLYYAAQNIERYPRLKAFLWTVSSRGMEPQYFGVSDTAVLDEQIKLLDSFLKLAYWE